MSNDRKITVTRNGPYLVCGSIPLTREIIICDSKGIPVKWENGEKFPDRETYALCRCGRSQDQPYCDGTHTKIRFDGTETAARKPFLDQAETISGPELEMIDVASLCATAKFCHRGGDTWQLTENSSDPDSIETAIRNARDCPSGRLVARDKKSGEPIEPDLAPSISVVEMPAAKLSGPLWVKGGIPIVSADGWLYEVRNRVTLCRCGKSGNKPFCDGAHFAIGFNDGDETVNE